MSSDPTALTSNFSGFFDVAKAVNTDDQELLAEINEVEEFTIPKGDEERAQLKISTTGDKLYWILRNLDGEEASYAGNGGANRRRGTANTFGPPIEKSVTGGTYEINIVDSSSITLRLFDKEGGLYRSWDGRGKVSSALRGTFTGKWS